MKPQQLILSGWGPYKDQVSIDFTKLDDGSVFLITGPTGSGKTTIFDGISYGLFGVPSGTFRDKDSLRSDFAAPETETFVTLLFEHHGKPYRITRYPRYSRPKIRGEGVVWSVEKAQLDLPDGRVIEKVTQVNSYMTALLGIDHHQFKQIAMIAQGEFQALLLADAQKRVEIFRNIFGTELYHRIQRLFAEKSKELYASLNRVNTKLEEVLASIQADGHETLKHMLEDAGYIYDVPKVLLGAIEEDQALLKDCHHQIRENVRIQKELSVALKNAEDSIAQMQQQQDVYTRRSQWTQQCRSQYDAVSQKYADIARLENRMVALKIEMSGLTQKLTEISEAKKYQDEAAAAGKASEQARDQLQTAVNVCEQSKVLMKELTEQLEDYRNVEVDIIGNRTQLQQYETDRRALEDKLLLAAQLDENLDAHAKAAAQLAETEQAMKAAADSYEKQQLRRMKHAAGILAQQLEDQQPCPVCGSLHHPQPCPLDTAIVSEATLTQLKNDSERNRQEFHDVLNRTSAIYERCCQLLKRLRPEDTVDPMPADKMRGYLSLILSDLHAQEAYLSQCAKTLKTQEKALSQKHRRFQQLQERLQTQKDFLEKSEEQLEKSRKSYTEIKTLAAQKHGAAQKYIEKYPDIHSEYQRMVQLRADGDAKITALKTQIADIRKTFESAKASLIEAQGQEKESQQTLATLIQKKEAAMQALTAQLAIGLCPDDALQEGEAVMVNAHQKLLVLEEKEKQQRDTAAALQVALSRNESACQSLNRHISRRQSLEEAYGRMRDLENIARGNNSKKLEFEQYVLGACFEEILEAANVRLDQMSRSRYQLLPVESVADRRKKNALDIDVFDQYTGKRRSVKTLSGGESFKAALSLALGLSDVITAHAGGTEMDMLLIDEGFGSLDDVSLECAVDTLMRFNAGRHLTGIISHVAQLKSCIEHQIIVDCDDEGSTIHMVI